MTDKEALELLNMFTTAAQIAKSKNKQEFHLNVNEAILVEWLKKAYPTLNDDINVMNIAKKILKNN